MLNKKVLSIFTIIVLGGGGMSALGLDKVCLFSEMQGTITLHGTPVVDAKIKRIINYNKASEDFVITDENGRFYFNSIFASGLLKLVPQEFTVGQEISVNYQGNEYSIWSTVKRSSQENSESNGKPLNLVCELTEEKRLVQIDHQPILTRCHWEADFDEIDTGF